MDEQEIERLADDVLQRVANPDSTRHVATEAAVMRALEIGQRLGLREPVRSIVGAILDAPATNRGADVFDVNIDDADPRALCVTVELRGGSIVPLVVRVAAA